MNKIETGISPEDAEHNHETEQTKFLKDKIVPYLKRLRAYVTAGLIGMGGMAVHEGMTSELKSEDPVDKIATGPILETIEDMDDALHKAGVTETLQGSCSELVTQGGETLRGIAENMISARLEKALETSTGQQWVLMTARHWARLNNLDGLGIDDPLPEGKTITLDSQPN